MSCKKSLATLGKEWKWVTLRGHSASQTAVAQRPAPGYQEGVQGGNKSKKMHELLLGGLPCSKNCDRLFKFFKEIGSDAS